MSNLTGKFNALQTFLTALFSLITTVLTSIDNKLDALADVNRKLGVVGIEEIGIYERLVNIDAWLNQIKTEASASTLHLNNIRIRAGTIDIRDALRYTLEQQVAAAIGASSGAGLAPLTTTQRNIAELLEIFNSNFGGVPGDAQESALYYLSKLEQLVGCGCGGGDPNLADPLGCAAPFTSNASALGQPYSVSTPRRNYAVFPSNLPATISFDVEEEFGPLNSALEFSNATGWSYYVQSTAASHQRRSDDAETFQNNIWIALPNGAGAYAWNVTREDALKVFLCAPQGALPSACTTYNLNLDIAGKWGYRVPELPGTWSVNVSDNWYAYNGQGLPVGGPYSAGIAYARSALPASLLFIRAGAGINEVAPTVELCPPE